MFSLSLASIGVGSQMVFIVLIFSLIACPACTVIMSYYKVIILTCCH